MNIGRMGEALIKSFENCKLVAYQDDGGVWTIGWGHTGSDVHPGLKITQAQADALFDRDIARFERDVTSLLTATVTQNQFDALLSFAYNCGSDIDADTKAEGLGDSTLLRLVNAYRFEEAAKEFPKWCKDNGKIVNGLLRRRNAEAALFAMQ